MYPCALYIFLNPKNVLLFKYIFFSGKVCDEISFSFQYLHLTQNHWKNESTMKVPTMNTRLFNNGTTMEHVLFDNEFFSLASDAEWTLRESVANRRSFQDTFICTLVDKIV